MQERIERDKLTRFSRWKRDIQSCNKFPWIENLLNKPIDANRYYCTWRILAPYLINVRGLSRQEALDIIQSWLDKCNSVKRLSFNIRKVNDVLDKVGSYYPIARTDLEHDNKLLFQLLKNEGVIS
jgi:hypothetical protein